MIFRIYKKDGVFAQSIFIPMTKTPPFLVFVTLRVMGGPRDIFGGQRAERTERTERTRGTRGGRLTRGGGLHVGEAYT